jgi:threonine-phosphate decarboxylase
MTGHGGNIYAASVETGIPANKIIDFSASINPLGTPTSVVAAIRKNIAGLRHYPEVHAGGLSAAIAKHTGLNPESVICGNGSTELIYLTARALRPERVLMPAPTFAEYERAVKISRKPEATGGRKLIPGRDMKGIATEDRSRIKYFDLRGDDGFRINADEFIDAMAGVDMAFICNPNNPTGGLVSRKNMERIANAAKETGCYLVLDESFIDFVPGQSIIRTVRHNPRLIVLRSLTKFYALSGLRLGYAAINPELAGIIKEFKEPWTVNSLAQAAGMAAINDRAYEEKSLKFMKDEKRYMESYLRKAGIEYYPASVNYYLLRIPGAREIVRKLRAKGILIRDCSNFRGLDASYVRIAVRSRKENDRMLRELCGR